MNFIRPQSRQSKRQYRQSNVQHADRTVPAVQSLGDFFDAKSGVVLEAKRIEADTKARHRQVYEIIHATFESGELRHNRRSSFNLNRAYAHAHHIADQGGQAYDRMLTTLRYAFSGPEAYADACKAVSISVND